MVGGGTYGGAGMGVVLYPVSTTSYENVHLARLSRRRAGVAPWASISACMFSSSMLLRAQRTVGTDLAAS